MDITLVVEFGLYIRNAAGNIVNFKTCTINRAPGRDQSLASQGSSITHEKCAAAYAKLKSGSASMEIITGPTEIGEYICGVANRTTYNLHYPPVIRVEELRGNA